MKPVSYKGLMGLAEIDADANVIRGKVVNTRDTITFQGVTVEETISNFQEAVDTYLEYCEELGVAPEKPYSGTFLVRVSPLLHRELGLKAQIAGKSVNQFVRETLEKGTLRAVRHPSKPMALRDLPRRMPAPRPRPKKYAEVE